MSHKLAIDFGTTNTVIARWDEQRAAPQIVGIPGISLSPLDGQPPVVPSLVYVREGQAGDVVIGQAVRDGQLDRQADNRLFRNFKRGVVALPTPDPREIDGISWGDGDAGQTFLRRLMELTPEAREGIDQLVLTAPVASFEGYLTWLNRVTGDFAPEQVYIVDESTAAALGYTVTEPGAVVLVFDFGGGTLDLSVVQLPEDHDKAGGFLGRLLGGSANQHKARVMAKTGRVIGGSDIDQWLLAEVLRRAGLTPGDVGSDYTALLTLCEQAKIQLSVSDETAVAFEIGGRAYRVTYTRPELEALLETNGFYRAIHYALDKVMHIAHRRGIFREDINTVLMVGGVALMPSVQAALRRYFTDIAVRFDKPFTAVAEGALQVAAGSGLDDYINQSYGLRHLDPETGEQRYDEIIPMGTSYPMEKPVEVILGTAHDRQAAMEFVVGEISASSGSLVEVQYENGQTVFVARTDGHDEQQNIIPLNADEAYRSRVQLGAKDITPRKGCVKAQFTVDDRRRLRLTVIDLKTKKPLLKNAVIATLVKQEAAENLPDGQVSGYEPHLVIEPAKRGQRRLSLKGVANALNMLPPEAITPDAAAAALRSTSFNARYNAAVALSKRGDRQARLVMQQVLADGDVPSRATVAHHLHGFSWFAAEPLVRQALQDPDSRVRESLMYALAEMHDLNAYRTMAEALHREQDNVREAAVFGLRDCQHPAAVPVLKAALCADDPEVRVKALEALSVNDTPDAIPVVRAMVNDRDSSVQYAALASMLELEKAACLPLVAELIHSSSGLSRQMILWAFFHATNYLNIDVAGSRIADELIDALQAALQDALPGARKAAIWPLAWIRHERMPVLLRAAYDAESDSGVKAHIVRVAAGLMSAAGEAILQDALISDDEAVKAEADHIMAERERTGIVLTYDESAAAGIGFAKPTVGR